MNKKENGILIELVEKVSKIEERTRTLPELSKQVDVNTTSIRFFKWAIGIFISMGTILALVYNKLKGG